MLHMLQLLYTYVVSFCSQCFICFFICMLQVFIWMLHMFHAYVASVLCGCCVCFIVVLSVFSGTSVLDICLKCFISLQTFLLVLHLDRLKLDQVLHLPPHIQLPCLSVSSSTRRPLGIRTRGTGERCSLLLFSMLVMFGVAQAHT
jgi:hypothetical protein